MKKQILLVALVVLFSGAVFAQGNAFSFQGRLNDGSNPANGRYDLEFKLFDAALGGTQIGPTVARPNTILINGVFSTTLDFGAQAFQNPNTIFIEIALKPNGSPNSFTILGPRQQLTVVPFASRAQNSVQLGGLPASEYITRTNGGADFIRNSTVTQADSNFNISGNGTVGGNFGVGGNPTSKLQVFGNIKATGAFPKITLNETRVSNADAEILNQDGELSFSINSTTRMWIRNDGRVAVGNYTIPTSQSNFQVTGGADITGALTMYGNVRQELAYNGLPKAMLLISSNATITRCFNGVTGATTGNCGFSVFRDNSSAYVITLNEDFYNRFLVLTGDLPGSASYSTNPPVDTVQVKVYLGTGVSTGTSGNFTLILF